MTYKYLGIIGDVSKRETRETAEYLVTLLDNYKFDTCLVPDTLVSSTQRVIPTSNTLDIAASSDVVFALGGDGTMLTSARAIILANPTTKLLGVNLGKLGFLAENPPQELPTLVAELSEDKLITEYRSLLSVSVRSENSSASSVTIRRDNLEPNNEGRLSDSAKLLALNEVVIDNFGSTRMLTLEIFVEGSLMGKIRADGLIISTPTGSTGYAVSAGGPIVEPTSPVNIIAPIAPHSLTVRPLIVPEEYEIVVRVTSASSTKTLIVADGQEEVVADAPTTITICHHKDKLRLLRSRNQSYFDLLRTKLLWSADAREQGKGRW